jgi:thioredoxin-related protein
MDNMTGKKPKKVAETSLSKGSEAPTFSLQDENNQEIKLEDYKGKKTLLVFSQEGCDYCEKFYPVLNAFLSQKEDVHVVVMQIGSTPAQNKIYKQQQDIKPTLLAATVNVVKNYKVEVTPTSVLLDEEGKIIASKGISELDELYDFVGKS